MSGPDPFIGRKIVDGQFEIVQKIGAGGMGAVYKGMQPAMGRTVAIKILHPRLANRQDLVTRFRREARAMSQLTHPNTVRVFLYGELEDDGALYIVMEFLEGKNLNQTVRRGGPMTADRAIPIMVQVCGALQEAHDQGIVHRDLKPENIFMTAPPGAPLGAGGGDFPKVLDFGLAKVTETQMRPGSIMLTQEGMVFGTPEFMSPEQAQGKVLDSRSDIYSLAIILYEMLTGKLPFDARSPMEHIQRHVVDPPIPLNQRVPALQFPPALEAALARALAKQPEERFATAREFAEALQAAIGLAPPGTAVASSPLAAPPPTPRPAPVEAPAPAGKQIFTPLVLVLIGVSFLLLGVVLALVVVVLARR